MTAVRDRDDEHGRIIYFNSLQEAQAYAKELARDTGTPASLQRGTHIDTWYVAPTWFTESLGSETLEHAHTRRMNERFYEKQQEIVEEEYWRSQQ